jgi:hypothetical protein
MAQIKDLLTIGGNTKQGDTMPTNHVLWYGTVVGPLPPDLATKIWIIIPDIDSHYKWGPCRWLNLEVPHIGDEVLVVFDNRQNPWVIAVWH